jgi:hypothetical protein
VLSVSKTLAFQTFKQWLPFCPDPDSSFRKQMIRDPDLNNVVLKGLIFAEICLLKRLIHEPDKRIGKR